MAQKAPSSDIRRCLRMFAVQYGDLRAAGACPKPLQSYDLPPPMVRCLPELSTKLNLDTSYCASVRTGWTASPKCRYSITKAHIMRRLHRSKPDVDL
jgi:hypothetical protein